jgi:hypothetical protein
VISTEKHKWLAELSRLSALVAAGRTDIEDEYIPDIAQQGNINKLTAK